MIAKKKPKVLAHIVLKSIEKDGFSVTELKTMSSRVAQKSASADVRAMSRRSNLVRECQKLTPWRSYLERITLWS